MLLLLRQPWAQAIFIAALLLIAYWALGREAGSLVSHHDKWVHGATFTFLTWLAVSVWPRRLLRVVLFVSVYGGLIEIGQIWVPNRSASWLDWGADLLGMSVYLGVHGLWWLRQKRQIS